MAAAPRANSVVKLLLKTQGRLILVDATDMVCASISDGIITIATREFRGHLQLSHHRRAQRVAGPGTVLAPASFSSVNINHIKEILPWFKSSYMLKMADKRQAEVPVSRAQTKRLRELLKM